VTTPEQEENNDDSVLSVDDCEHNSHLYKSPNHPQSWSWCPQLKLPINRCD
jgi:hypothetical protein